MRKKNQITGILFSFALILGLMPGLALTVYADQDPVSYMEWNGTAFEEKTAEDYTVVDSGTDEFADGGWYVVTGVVETGSRISVSGSAHLILCDGAKLTAEEGIDVPAGNTLSIYGQSGGTGELESDGDAACAGIGGGNEDNGGTINIHGGKVTATGGSTGSPASTGGAGIGGGNYGTGGTVNIYGGTVTAVGGYGGAGIGGGNFMPGGTVTISGGTVDATGGVMGAGIGGGNYGDGGTVTIDGGTVTATGGGKDEGTVSIGGAAGIGGGSEGNGGTVAINGGKVTAAGSKGYYDLGMGIGAGEFQPDSQHSNGTLTLGTYVILEISKNGEDWTDSTDDPSKRTQYMRTSEAEVPEYTITYVLNGGSLNGRTGTVKEKHREGTVITLPAPVRDGYTFDYWEGSAYKAGDEYMVEEDHEFTAVWKSGGTDPSDDPSDDGGGGSDPSGRNTDGGGSSSSGKKGVSTGDDSAAGAWITMFLIALAGTAGMVVLRKRDSL